MRWALIFCVFIAIGIDGLVFFASGLDELIHGWIAGQLVPCAAQHATSADWMMLRGSQNIRDSDHLSPEEKALLAYVLNSRAISCRVTYANAIKYAKYLPSAYDFTRGLAFYFGPGLACRAAPGLLPLALLPFAALPSDRATPSRRPNYRSESEPARAEVGAREASACE